ncbi:MAG: hypothetical protein WBB39_03435 [Candidatus Saccharimonadales bacterium]
MNKSSDGFTLVEAVLIVVIVALLGLVGYNLYTMQSAKDEVANQPNAQTSLSAPAIAQPSDLDKASSVLDATPDVMSDAELNQLENDASF